MLPKLEFRERPKRLSLGISKEINVTTIAINEIIILVRD